MDFIPIARPSLNHSDLDGVRDVFTSRWLGLGRVTAEFESQLSKLCDDRPVLATNTGTTAIELALRTIGIGPGDDVLVPAMTFVATAQAIRATGAQPILCDIDASTLNVSVETLESARTVTTRAAVPVSYRGLALDIESIVVWGKENAIRIVEDAAHAFGSQTPERVPAGVCDRV